MVQAPLTGASSESVLVNLAKAEPKQPTAVNTLSRLSSSVYKAVVDRSREFDFPALTSLLLDLEQKRAGNAVWAMIDLFPALPFCHRDLTDSKGRGPVIGLSIRPELPSTPSELASGSRRSLNCCFAIYLVLAPAATCRQRGVPGQMTSIPA